MTQYSNSNATDENESSEAIKADIERTRNQMSNKIDSIQERLSPETLKTQAQDAIRGAINDGADSLVEYMRGHSNELGASLVQTVKNNPLPSVLIGVGVGWLLLNNLSGNSQGNSRDQRWQAGRGRSYNPQGTANFYSESEYAGSEYTPYSSAESWQGQSTYSDERSKGIGQQVRDKVGQVTSAVREKVSEISEQVSDKTGELTDQIRSSTQNLRDDVQDKTGSWSAQAQGYREQTGAQMHTVMEENALTVGAAALIAGAVLGFILPATRRENEMMGEWRDQVVEKAQNVASDVAQQTKEMVQEVKSEAQNAAAHVVDELAQTGKEALGASSSASASTPTTKEGDKVTA